MKKIFCILFIIISTCAINAQNQKISDFKIIYPNQKTLLTKLITLNGKTYISLDELAKLVFPLEKYNFTEYLINTDKTKIMFSAGSLYSIFYFSNEYKIIQMNLPVIKFENKILFPFPSFFISCNELGLINSKLSNSQLIITKSRISDIPSIVVIEKNQANQTENPLLQDSIISKSLKEIKPENKIINNAINKDKSENDNIIFEYDSVKINPVPNSYQIPPTLIRKKINK